MNHESEAEQWWAKAQRAEEQALKATDKRTADTWNEIARIYRDLAARRDAWEKAWKPRERHEPTPDSGKDKSA